MIESWVDFVFSVIGGATAFLCLFDGTRRLCAYGVHRKAVLMTGLAAGICALYGGFAYWKYADLKATLSMNQRRPRLRNHRRIGQTFAGKNEILSLARARHTFMESGKLASYIDRSGETRTFAPTPEDLMRRERVVAYYSRTEYSARSSLAEALLWMIIALVAVVFGTLMSFEKVRRRPAQLGNPATLSFRRRCRCSPASNNACATSRARLSSFGSPRAIRHALVREAPGRGIVAYALSPIDLIPDFVPVLGYLTISY